MTAFSESTVETAALDWLGGLGYQVQFGPTIALDEAERPELDRQFEEATEGEEIEHKQKLKHRSAHFEA